MPSEKRAATGRSSRSKKCKTEEEVNPWSLPPPPGQLSIEGFRSGSKNSRVLASAPVHLPEAADGKDEEDHVKTAARRKRKPKANAAPMLRSKPKMKVKAKGKAKPKPAARICRRRPAACAASADTADSAVSAADTKGLEENKSCSSSGTSSSSSSSSKSEPERDEAKAGSLRYEPLDDSFATAGSSPEATVDPKEGDSSPLRTTLRAAASDLDNEQVRCISSMFRFPFRHASRVQQHFGTDALERLRENLDGCVLLSLYSGLGGAELSLHLG